MRHHPNPELVPSELLTDLAQQNLYGFSTDDLPVRIALIQSNPLVGDLRGNRHHLQEQCRQAAQAGAELALAPELALWGYPPRDLLLQPTLQHQQDRQLDQLSGALDPGFGLLLGVVETSGSQLFNAMALVEHTGWRLVARKRLLPSYDVFDEQRYFHSGDQPALLSWGGQRLGLTCAKTSGLNPRSAAAARRSAIRSLSCNRSSRIS